MLLCFFMFVELKNSRKGNRSEVDTIGRTFDRFVELITLKNLKI